MSELKPCKVCGGKVDWCQGIDDCKGCHLIVCDSCKSVFDLSQCDGVRGGSLYMLRNDIAGIYNNRVPMNCDIRADVLALCQAAQTDDAVRFALGGDLCRAVDRISERLRGSDANQNEP